MFSTQENFGKRTTAALALWLCVLCCSSNGSCFAQSTGVMANANARILQHRTAQRQIRLFDQDGKPLPAGTRIRLTMQRHAFLFGGNLFQFETWDTAAQNDAYQRSFAEVMNFATLGVYWYQYEPQQGQVDAERIERAAQWCRDNDIRVKGHPLVWTYEPPWTANLAQPAAEEALWERVDREVRFFRGRIDTWDVLNEPCVGPKQAQERNSAALLRTYQQHGVRQVIKRSFQQARSANSDAVLILNDYDNTVAYENVIRQAIADQVTFDAIGLQTHMHQGYWGAEYVWQICERFAQFQKPLHFTEVTLLSGELKDPNDVETETQRQGWHSTVAGEQRQATQLQELYTLLFSHPSVEAITWWDFSDAHAWQGAPAGLLRKDLTRKPAYETLKRLVRQRWWTPEQTVVVDANGQVTLRGFLGEYQVTVVDSPEQKAFFSLGRAARPST
ncbi:MAG: endo-1,4-beta-xylanase [Pirellulaceae bacterium]